MHEIVNIPAVQILIVTLPVTALLALTLLDQKSFRGEIRQEFAEVHKEIGQVRDKVSDVAQRISKIEGHHIVLEN